MLKKFILNVFSNWTNMIVSIVIAFIVSPILVRQLGLETYGIWVLIVSITGYFTVLDFGINTAIVRYISKYAAAKKWRYANQIYNTSFAFFILVGLLVMIASLIFSWFFKDLFSINLYSREYLYYVFTLVGFDLALNLIFSVYLGTLTGLQRFFEINLIIISTNILKNIILVILLLNNYSLLSIAILQLSISTLKYTLQYIIIKKSYTFLYFSSTQISKKTFHQIYHYSIYIFLIAIATKILFFTDSIVIGSMLGVEQITFYAIPAMIAEYLDKFIWAITAVLIPIVSAKDNSKNLDSNRLIYRTGTKYTILLFSPVILVLLTAGKSFISLWMGPEIAQSSGPILIILMSGYVFYLSQMIAHGILTGLSKHKILALILCIEALSNLFLSVYLAPVYGLTGVAYGTIIPMLIANLIAIPLYTSHVLNINYFGYIIRTLTPPLLSFLLFYFLLHELLNKLSMNITTYTQLILYSLAVLISYSIFSFFVHIENPHKKLIMHTLKNGYNTIFCRKSL